MKHLEVPLLSFHSVVYQRLIFIFFFPESADSLLMGVLLIMLIMLF